MIHLILAGGMGNQMFEYAYALQVQKQNPSDNICINPVLLQYRSDGRSNSLHHFRLSESTSHARGWKAYWLILRFVASMPYAFGVKNLIAKCRKRFQDNEQLRHQRVERGLYYSVDTYNYMPPGVGGCLNKYLYGYFQHVRVTENIEKLLKAQFEIITPPSSQNKKLLEEIRSVNAVCLHIRRGDYMLEKYKQLQVCTYAYYAEAVKRAKTELESPRFFVFSTGHEDMEWIKRNYLFDADITYVDLDNPDYEELRLMKACRHFIISNSTFSWWAAFLGGAEDKKVWAPEEWMKYVMADMYPATWEKVSC